MSSRTTNIGLEKVTSDQTIGDLQESMNGSGGNMDIIDTKMGPVGNTSLQAQVNALNSQLTKTTKDGSTFTEVNGNITINTSRINSKAGIVTCTIAMKITGAIAAYTKLFTIPVHMSGETNLNLVTLDGTSIPCYVNSSGEVFGRANIPVAQWAQTNFAYME